MHFILNIEVHLWLNLLFTCCHCYSTCNQYMKWHFPFLDCNPSDNSLHLRTQHDYWHQIQGQLYLTGTQCCDLVVWTQADIQVVRIEKDASWSSNILNMIEFYYKVFLPSLWFILSVILCLHVCGIINKQNKWENGSVTFVNQTTSHDTEFA